MCGIFGGFFKKQKDDNLLSGVVEILKQRGPDSADCQQFKIGSWNACFGHTRLAILDLRPEACQPMWSHCGRYCLVFNGEIYNYKEIRRLLVEYGYNFRSLSDTEVLLNFLIEFGCTKLVKLVGMFSFAFYDRIAKKLILCRDGFGIKPLFFTRSNGEFAFSSDIRALITLCEIDPRPNVQVAYDYLVHGDYDSSGCSFVKGIFSVRPGEYIVFDVNSPSKISRNMWWVPTTVEDLNITFEDASRKLRTLFIDSIKYHLISDVPVAVALSGGIDSSAIVSAIRYIHPNKEINTFSYIASDSNMSEEKWINLLSEHLKLNLHKVYIEKDKLLGDLDDLISSQGEPFGGTSIYAQYCISRSVRKSGSLVLLEGQGADELLAGYDGYPGHRLLSLIETGKFLGAIKFLLSWRQISNRTAFFAIKDLGRIVMPDRIYALLRHITGRNFRPYWLNIPHLSKHNVRFHENRQNFHSSFKGRRVVETLAHSLQKRGLQSLLRHGDRNSMRFSVESRVPFLTIELAEFLLSMPEEFLISKIGQTKHLFREAMRGIVSDDILDREDKVGFLTPEYNLMLSLRNRIKEIIDESPELEFLNKELSYRYILHCIEQPKNFDRTAWRLLNYYRWATILGIK